MTEYFLAAQRKMMVASQKGLVFRFTRDEAKAYLAYIRERKLDFVAMRRRTNEIVTKFAKGLSPSAVVEWQPIGDRDAAAKMVSYLETVQDGGSGNYSPEDAKALVHFIDEMARQEDALLEFQRSMI